MLIVGIDPGKKGGIAAIDSDTRQIVEAFVMPEPHVLADFFDTLTRDDHVFLEKAQVMGRGASPVAMFNYGTDYGKIIGILIGLHIKYTLVTPSIWAKEMHQGIQLSNAKAKQKNATKLKSFEACHRLFPGFSLIPERCRVEHDGMAEAILIAEYGRRKLNV